MVVTEEWAYIWGLKEWLWNLRQIALFFQTSLILKMEMIIPNNRVSVSIAVLSTLNMARDSPMVLTVTSPDHRVSSPGRKLSRWSSVVT